jgi:hypothetical protein
MVVCVGTRDRGQAFWYASGINTAREKTLHDIGTTQQQHPQQHAAASQAAAPSKNNVSDSNQLIMFLHQFCPGDHKSGLRTSRSLLVLRMYVETLCICHVYVRVLASQ